MKFVTQGIGFSLGQYSDQGKPFGTHAVDRIFIPFAYGKAGHSLEQNKAYDYALVRLKTPIQDGKTMKLGWFPWFAKLRKMHATAIGYPYDFGPSKAETAWYSKGIFPSAQPWKSIFGAQAGLLRTNIDAAGGMSGGPVYVWNNNERRLTGIMIGSPKGECKQGYTWATRIMPGTIHELQKLMNGPYNLFWRFRNVPTPPVVGGGIGGGFGG